MRVPFGFSVVALVLASCACQVQAQTAPAAYAAPTGWVLDTHLSDHALSDRLPVLKLDGDWTRSYTPSPQTAHAWRALRAELGATHASGWRVAAIARAEAQLRASGDTVDALALDQQNADPSAPRRFSIRADYLQWRGTGIRVDAPPLPLERLLGGRLKGWQLRANAQLLRLDLLRTGQASGEINFVGNGVYDFALQADRADANIDAPFLAESKGAGLGGSASLELSGPLAAGWLGRITLQDALSSLRWSGLRSEAQTLNSQVSTRAPDGTLEFAPLIVGQQSLRNVRERISPLLDLGLAWQKAPGADGGDWTASASRKAGLNQVWLGWQSEHWQDARHPLQPLAWQVQAEPARGALRLALQYRQLQIMLATDDLSANARLRQLGFVWRLSLGV